MTLEIGTEQVKVMVNKAPMKFVWYVSVILAFIQIITSLSTCVINAKAPVGGYKSAGFTAIWCLFLVFLYEYLTYQMIFKGKHDEGLVGFTIGLSAMMSQLFFMVSCFFFGLGEEAFANGYATMSDDKAYASFSLFYTVVLVVMSYMLYTHRKELQNDSEEEQTHDAISEPTYNAAQSSSNEEGENAN